MSIPNMQAYDLKCVSCGWEDIRAYRKSYGLRGILDKLWGNFPSKCPECGKKVTVRKNNEVIF